MPLFFRRQPSYTGFMIRFPGWGARPGAVLNENKGSPWGSGGGTGGSGGGGSGSGGGGNGGDGPKSPWGQPPRKRKPGVGGPGGLLR